MTTRLQLSPTHFGDVMAAMQGLTAPLEKSGLEPARIELVKVRVSQMNGCGFCLDMHTTDARLAGETEQRLYLRNAWREAPMYSARERAALLAQLKKNDEVETSGGIFGVVQTIKESGDEVVLKLEDNAKMRVRRSSIVRILPKESAGTPSGTTASGPLSVAIQKPPRG